MDPTVGTPSSPRPGGVDRDREIRLGRRCRPFTPLDGMIVLAGVGSAVAGWRYLASRDETYRGPSWIFWAREYANFLLILASAFVLALRLIEPRPPLRRVVRQPGAVGCLAILAYAFLFDGSGVTWNRGYRSLLYSMPGTYLHNTVFAQTPCWVAVASSWIFLGVCRLGRRERGWIDLAGRLVGWSSLAISIVWWVGSYLRWV